MDILFHILAELLNAERLGILPALLRCDTLFCIKVADGFDDALDGLLLEEAAGLAVFDGFESTAFAVGDDGGAAGLGLDWGDAEVFFGGKDEGFGVLHLVLEDFEGLIAHHLNVRLGNGLCLLEVGTVADDDELLVGHLVEGFDDELDLLVGHHARGGQVVVLFVLAAGEGRDIDWRVDDVSFAAVNFLDAPRDKAAVGDEVVDAIGCARIPDAHVVQDELGKGSLEAVVEAGFAQVLVREVPGIANGAVHIGNVDLVRPGQDAFGDTVRARNDEVVVGDVELLDGNRHEGQIAAIVLLGAGEFLDETRMGLLILDEIALAVGQEVDESEQVGLREDIEDLLDDTLGTGVDDEPVADNSYFHSDTSPLCFALVHDKAVAEGDDAAEGEADGGDEFLFRCARLLLIRQVGGVDDLDIHGLHGFLDLVLLALLDEVGVDGLLDLGVALELEIGDHVIGVFVDVLLDLGFLGADGVFAGLGGADGGFGYGLVLEEFHLGGIKAGGIGVDDGADLTGEVALQLVELLLGGDDGRVVVGVLLAQADELDFFGDDLAADALDGAVVVDVIGLGTGLLLAELVRGDVVLGLGGFLLALEVGDGLVVGGDLGDGLLQLVVGAVELVLAREVGKLLGGIVGVLLGLFDAAVEELDEQALGLLAVVRLHGQEVVDDFLGDLLGLFRGLALSSDLDEVRALRVLDVEVFFCEVFGLRLFLGVLPVHLVNDRLEDGAALHELHVIVGGARRAAARRSGEHSCCLAAHLLAGAARLHEGRRLILLRQDKGGDRRDGCAADDDAANDFLVFLRDLPELAEVDAFFFL